MPSSPSPSPRSLGAAALLALFLPVSGLAINGSDVSPPNVLAPRAACGADAKCQASALILHSTWAKIQGADTFTAFTVVVVSNTVKKTSSESTIWREPPPDFVPPRTNGEGRKVETVSYLRDGVLERTTVAFPTVFYAWNGEYVVDGQVPITSANGGSSTCLPVTKSTISFPGNPQPGAPRNQQPGINPGADVLGWGYTLQPAGTTKFFSLIDLLPNPTGLPLSAVKACEEVAPSYAAGASPKFDAPWLAVGARQTVFVGEKDADTPATKLLTQEGISKVTASPTPVPPGVSLPTGSAVASASSSSSSGSGSGNGSGNKNNGGGQGGDEPSGTGTGRPASGTSGAGQGGGSGSGSSSAAFALTPLSAISWLVMAACVASF